MAGPPYSKEECLDCKGTGKYVGLQAVEACQTCGGTGSAQRRDRYWIPYGGADIQEAYERARRAIRDAGPMPPATDQRDGDLRDAIHRAN